MDFILPEDDWGCVPNEDLFFSAGPTPSLRSLVERLEKKATRSADEEIVESVTTEFTNLLDPALPSKNDEKIVLIKAEKEVLKTPTGILKKGTSTSDDSAVAPSLKRVTFEIERFVAANIGDRDERLSAQQQLVVKLGARPLRRKAMNYKQLKNQRLEAKRREGEEAALGKLDDLWLRGTNGGRVSKKRKLKRNRQNRSGTVKKGNARKGKGNKGKGRGKK